MTTDPRSPALTGVRVLDLGVWRPVPHATALLGEMGASVIKVEPPGGDPLRSFPDLYTSLNARKRVVEVDLKSRTGRAQVLDLAAGADVVAEGFRPGVMERLGVGYEIVRNSNPGIVYCSVTGFGSAGPLAHAPGHDLNYQAWSGVLGERAPEVFRPGVPVADLAAGSYAAMAICAALLARERDGAGDHIEVPMTDVLATWAAPGTRLDAPRAPDRPIRHPAYGTFRCARDEWITLGVLTEDHFWRPLCEQLGLTDVAGLRLDARMSDAVHLRSRLADAIADRDRDEIVSELLACGVPVAPVLDRQEAAVHPQFTSQGVVAPGPNGTVVSGHPNRFALHAALSLPAEGPAFVTGGESVAW
jgi:crotonobetainyl-CoA:carnitine CoA-transferase CaiB-like acyl-CoA transferase